MFSTRDIQWCSDGQKIRAWVSSTHTSQGNLQLRSEMTTWYFCGDKAHRIMPEKHLWGDTFWILAKGKAPSCLWSIKQEEVELASMRYQKKTWEWPPRMTLQVQKTNSHIPKAHLASRVCFLWQGVEGMVLCPGDLLEGTDQKTKYAFHLYRLYSTAPPSAILCSKGHCTPYQDLPKGLPEASEMCLSKANKEHHCH